MELVKLGVRLFSQKSRESGSEIRYPGKQEGKQKCDALCEMNKAPFCREGHLMINRIVIAMFWLPISIILSHNYYFQIALR